jgi:hypothetical protein
MEFKKQKKHQKMAEGEPAHLWCHWVWPYEKIDHTVMLVMPLMLLLVQSWRRRNGSRKTRRSTRRCGRHSPSPNSTHCSSVAITDTTRIGSTQVRCFLTTAPPTTSQLPKELRNSHITCLFPYVNRRHSQHCAQRWALGGSGDQKTFRAVGPN